MTRRTAKNDYPVKTVCMNAYTTDEDGNVTYTDVPELIEGYSVYLRVEKAFNSPEPFDVLGDEDFNTKSLALAYARKLSREHKLNPEDIHEY